MEGETPFNSVSLKILDTYDKLSDSGIESVHFLGVGIELGKLPVVREQNEADLIPLNPSLVRLFCQGVGRIQLWVQQ
ncbi:hypothetical protein ROHU_006200 [Labeo rohita]|nr:hypothetical protein ROHU_006200 [Labeo rohita]